MVRLCFKIVSQPIHLSFNAKPRPITAKANSSIILCRAIGIYGLIYHEISNNQLFVKLCLTLNGGVAGSSANANTIKTNDVAKSIP